MHGMRLSANPQPGHASHMACPVACGMYMYMYYTLQNNFRTVKKFTSQGGKPRQIVRLKNPFFNIIFIGSKLRKFCSSVFAEAGVPASAFCKELWRS